MWEGEQACGGLEGIGGWIAGVQRGEWNGFAARPGACLAEDSGGIEADLAACGLERVEGVVGEEKIAEGF